MEKGGVWFVGRTPASAKRDITPAESLSRALHPIRIQTSTIPPKNTTTRVMMVTAMTIRCIPPALLSVAASEVCMPSWSEFKMGLKKTKLKGMYICLEDIANIYKPPVVHLQPKSSARKSAHYLGWDWQSARRACARQFPCLHDVPNNKLLIYSTNYLLFLSGGGRGGSLKTWTRMTEYLPISAQISYQNYSYYTDFLVIYTMLP